MNRAERTAMEIVKQVEFHIGNQRKQDGITIDAPLLIAQIYAILLKSYTE